MGGLRGIISKWPVTMALSYLLAEVDDISARSLDEFGLVVAALCVSTVPEFVTWTHNSDLESSQGL